MGKNADFHPKLYTPPALAALTGFVISSVDRGLWPQSSKLPPEALAKASRRTQGDCQGPCFVDVQDTGITQQHPLQCGRFLQFPAVCIDGSRSTQQPRGGVGRCVVRAEYGTRVPRCVWYRYAISQTFYVSLFEGPCIHRAWCLRKVRDCKSWQSVRCAAEGARSGACTGQVDKC